MNSEWEWLVDEACTEVQNDWVTSWTTWSNFESSQYLVFQVHRLMTHFVVNTIVLLRLVSGLRCTYDSNVWQLEGNHYLCCDVAFDSDLKRTHRAWHLDLVNNRRKFEVHYPHSCDKEKEARGEGAPRSASQNCPLLPDHGSSITACYGFGYWLAKFGHGCSAGTLKSISTMMTTSHIHSIEAHKVAISSVYMPVLSFFKVIGTVT